jgi:hypothetical protein
MLAATPARAEGTGSPRQTVAGVEIYFGVVPAAMVREHPRQHPEGRMHGGTAGRGYHVMVALFETKNGARITDAQVGVRLVSPSQSGPETRLEPMTIAGAQTYGNYLDMAPGGSYRIAVSVRRPGIAEPIHATFHWMAR